ncbi:methionyl-tRNA formyltransferase [Buchnera aphidicola (Nipponaphis monzeni)]|uniref:Methionyl-tRNA formyltransferase n=1 Tax=Buchnera aphidicola (Nipponaphis monzeni) TaxID=2495405 RepID=A0A455TAP1_9GAMM|nr:methionyl-tRNA formyltransferase [Buchnera aphidicola]BBI01374.1 methionyl-tRNA formyltransferase [Buchnera aphidicola (Nipponaphis monzeni)]
MSLIPIKKYKTSLRIIFAGTSKFAVQHLNALLCSKHQIIAILTKPDSISGRGNKICPSPIKSFALKKNIIIITPKSLQSSKIKKKIYTLNADLMLVVSYGLIIPKYILTMFPLGCINIHASLLPRLRGPSPIERSILNGETKTGITTFIMNEFIDTGDIIHILQCPINNNDTKGSLYIKLYKIGIKCMFITLFKIITRKYSLVKQNDTNATYAKKIEKKEGQLNWNLPAETLNRTIRAFNPYPTAYFIINNHKIKVWKASVLKNTKKYIPGKIVTLNKKGLQIATSHNILNIQSIQMPGKKIINSIDIYNAYKKLFIP